LETSPLRDDGSRMNPRSQTKVPIPFKGAKLKVVLDGETGNLPWPFSL